MHPLQQDISSLSDNQLEEQIKELTKKNQEFAIKCGDEKIEISKYYSKKIDTIYIRNTEQISDLNNRISKQLIELNFYKNPKKNEK